MDKYEKTRLAETQIVKAIREQQELPGAKKKCR